MIRIGFEEFLYKGNALLKKDASTPCDFRLSASTITFYQDGCSDPRARPDPIGESEPKPWGRPFNSFILNFIKFSFSKVSRPESQARPEWRIRIGARFIPTFSFILSKHLIMSFRCGSGFSFGQAHNHLQFRCNSVGP